MGGGVVYWVWLKVHLPTGSCNFYLGVWVAYTFIDLVCNLTQSVLKGVWLLWYVELIGVLQYSG